MICLGRLWCIDEDEFSVLFNSLNKLCVQFILTCGIPAYMQGNEQQPQTVDGLLQVLGLQKYQILFKAEEVRKSFIYVDKKLYKTDFFFLSKYLNMLWHDILNEMSKLFTHLAAIGILTWNIIGEDNLLIKG